MNVQFLGDYTADINLLYLDESNEINEFKQKLESSELVISSEKMSTILVWGLKLYLQN